MTDVTTTSSSRSARSLWPGSSLLRHTQPTWTAFVELFDDRTFFELVGTMTTLLVILHLDSRRGLREGIILFCAVSILDRRLLHRPAYWFGLTGLLVVNHLQQWQVMDNHKYLQTYWCLALGLSCFRGTDRSMVALNARWLIGLCFLFATLWKLSSAEFMSGAFFQHTMLTDPRFRGFADLIGGVPPDVTAANVEALEKLRLPYTNQTLAQLTSSSRIVPVSLFLTYWTIAIEGSIALLFLLPERFRLSAVRDLSLLLFMFSTYPVATVVSFGRLLSLMGLAQTPNRLGFERAVYFACFVLLPLYEFPFVRTFRSIFG